MTAPRRSAVTEREIAAVIERAAAEGPVMAPVRRGRSGVAFDRVEEPGEVRLGYVRTILPPKRAMFPERDEVLEFRRVPRSESSAVLREEPYLLLGVHPCDLAAIGQLDWAMGVRHEVADPHYLARRSGATIVGVECLPDEYCFCPSVGTCDTREGADVFLTPMDGGYVVEVLSEKGGALLEGWGVGREASAGEASEVEGWSEKKRGMTSCEIEADLQELADLLEAGYGSGIWEETAQRCYSCGTCTNVCPTCFCFEVKDWLELGLESGRRGREYDSCQFLEFALVAGGHNFREEREDRVRHRWFRKFVRLLREYGKPFCVGCGRCTKGCTAGISWTSVLNSVIAEGKGAVR